MLRFLSIMSAVGLGVFALVGVLPHSAWAQAIDVDFEVTPLFLNADVKPGDSTTRNVSVTNTGTSAEDLYISVQNEFSTGLAEVMELTVVGGSNTYFSGTFAEFFAAAPLPLTAMPGSATQDLAFTASLDTSVGNEYQLTQLGFDLVVGFAGGPSVTDTSGGGGGGGGSIVLTIANEDVVVDGTSATITWTTNRSATSFVVCGLTAAGPFTLSTTPPFGYQFVLEEVIELVSVHSMTQIDLAPGDYECRPASRRDTDGAFTVGIPVTFTIAGPDGIVAGESISVPTAFPTSSVVPTGSVLGYGKGTLGGPTYDEWRTELDRLQAERDALGEPDALATNTTEVASNNQNQTVDSWLADDRVRRGGWILAFLLLLLGVGTFMYRRFA